jgi:lipopolysaccharide export system protein LptC
MITRVLTSAVIMGLLIAGLFVLYNEQSGPAAPPPAARPTSPGYAAQDAVLVETAPDGDPMYTLHAARIRQEPASQITTLDQVQMQFRDEAGNVWNGRADEGQVLNGASQVELIGHVTIAGLLPGTNQPVQVASDRLNVDTRTEVVTTDDPVVLDWNGQLVHARGLVARLKEQWVRLESNVHGHYVP